MDNWPCLSEAQATDNKEQCTIEYEWLCDLNRCVYCFIGGLGVVAQVDVVRGLTEHEWIWGKCEAYC
jgi:hypothetical protein